MWAAARRTPGCCVGLSCSTRATQTRQCVRECVAHCTRLVSSRYWGSHRSVGPMLHARAETRICKLFSCAAAPASRETPACSTRKQRAQVPPEVVVLGGAPWELAEHPRRRWVLISAQAHAPTCNLYPHPFLALQPLILSTLQSTFTLTMLLRSVFSSLVVIATISSTAGETVQTVAPTGKRESVGRQVRAFGSSNDDGHIARRHRPSYVPTQSAAFQAAVAADVGKANLAPALSQAQAHHERRDRSRRRRRSPPRLRLCLRGLLRQRRLWSWRLR